MAKGAPSCPHCQRAVSLRGPESGFLVCPHCRRGSNHHQGRLARHAGGVFPAPAPASLALSDGVTVQGRRYTVGGIAQYRDSDGHLSTDYDLIGRGDEVIGLEESDGEWTLNRYLPNGERLVKVEDGKAGLFKRTFTFDARYDLEVTAAVGEFEEPFNPRAKWRFDYYAGDEYGLVAERSPSGAIQAWYLSYALRPDEIGAPAGRRLAGGGGLGERISGFLGLAGSAAAPAARSRSPLLEKPASDGQVLRWSLIFAGIAVLLHVLFLITAQNKPVLDSGPRSTGEARQSNWISEPFELSGRRSNVQVKAETSLSNQWLGFELALVNKSSGKVFHIYEDAAYWYGYDGGESWSEGTPRPDFYFSSIPAGTYVLEVMTYADAPNLRYRLVLRRDVPRGSYLLYILIAFAALPALFWLRRHVKS
jgi:hypothetical protein